MVYSAAYVFLYFNKIAIQLNMQKTVAQIMV